MDSEVLEEALRAGLRRCATQVPPESSERLQQIHYRQGLPRAVNRWTVGTAALSGLAAAGVLAGTLATGSSRHPPGPPAGRLPVFDARTIAFEVNAALDRAGANDVEYIRSQLVAADGTRGAVIEQWRHDNSWRSEFLGPAGTPGLDLGYTSSGCRANLTVVNYQRRTWFTVDRALVMLGPNGEFNQADVAGQIRQQVADGQLQTAGRTAVDGQPAIELTGVLQGGVAAPVQSPSCRPIAVPTIKPPETWRYTITVSSATYLPIRFAATKSTTGAAPGPRSGPTIEGTIEWLPSTPANLADVGLRVPPGFSAIPPGGG